MIDIELLRSNPDQFRDSMKKRNLSTAIVDDFLALDGEWRKHVGEIEKLRAEQKKLGKRMIATPLEGGEPRPAETGREEAKKLKEQITGLEAALETLAAKRLTLVRHIPNLIADGVPTGKDDSENVTAREVGTKPNFDFPVQDYVALSEKLGIIDTQHAGKVSGSRFGYIMGGLAQLQFALLQFAIETVTNTKLLEKLITDNNLNVPATPFIPVIPPVMIKREMMEGMGYVERGSEEIYLFEKDDLYLVGTSEQSIGPMHSGETFDASALPRRYLGYSTCFRREAGSYGKDTKGILRVHQFNKSEMFSISTAASAGDEHKLFLAIEEYLMQQLELPYRVLNICSGDLGDPAAAKYDIEVWLPGQLEGKGQYRETHSTSNTTDFQSRRLGIRYHSTSDGQRATRYVHMVNGTAFSDRPLLAIIENNQTKEGTIKVPKVLQKYCGGLTEIR